MIESLEIDEEEEEEEEAEGEAKEEFDRELLPPYLRIPTCISSDVSESTEQRKELSIADAP